MSEVIVITSGKGGVGKTTTTANIGMGLAQMNKRVVMVDTDIGLRNLDVVLGLENRIIYNLVDVIEGNCRLKQALIRDKRYPNLFLLPSAQTRDKSSVSPEQMKKLVEQMRDDFDYIILDCPAGIEQGFQNAVAGADRALIVTTPEVAAIRDADRIIGLLEARQIRIGIGYLIKDRFIIMENLMFLIIVTDVNFRTETKITAIRRNELINDFEDRCLSRTVIADKGHTLTPFNIHGYILKQILTVITFCQIFNE